MKVSKDLLDMSQPVKVSAIQGTDDVLIEQGTNQIQQSRFALRVLQDNFAAGNLQEFQGKYTWTAEVGDRETDSIRAQLQDGNILLIGGFPRTAEVLLKPQELNRIVHEFPDTTMSVPAQQKPGVDMD